MHFLDLFWGAQKRHKIDPNSSRFCWNVTRCVSMFYSKSVKTEFQDSVKCAKFLKCQEKMSFQWGTNQTEKITFWERMKNPDSYNVLLENDWTWDVWCLQMCFVGKALAAGWNNHFLGNAWMPTYAHAVLRTAWLAACSHLWFTFLTKTICQDAET